MVTNIQVTGRMEQATTIHAWEASLNLRRPAPAEDPYRAARRNARNLYRAGAKAIDSAAQNLEEELKQTSPARKLIYYAIHAHLTDQHSRARGYLLAAEQSEKGVMK